MNDSALGTIAQLRAFLEGTLSVSFAPFADDDARYAHIASVVRRFGYARLSKPDKGVVLRYLARTSGYSRAQLTRLLARVLDGAPLGKRYRAPAHAFARRYTPADVDLLLAVETVPMVACPGLRRPICCAGPGMSTGRCPLRTPGAAVTLAPVQLAQDPPVPGCPAVLHQDPSRGQSHR